MEHPFVLVSTARRVSIAFAVVLLNTLALAAVAGTPAAAASSVTVTFQYNGTTGADGTPQHWTVPPNVHAVTVDVYGAEGGGTGAPPGGAPGGKGGYVHATLAVMPGQVLSINVGGHGVAGRPHLGGTLFCRSMGPPIITLGGYNGGGRGGDAECPGASGGGASDIRSGGATLADRVIAAGGGGGAANAGCPALLICANGGNGGGDTGASGTAVFSGTAPAGGGGTQTSGGSAVTDSAGRFGVGGPGEKTADPRQELGGGGGGGGWYGGGGGGALPFPAAGGGGGSGHAAATATGVSMTSGARSGDGLVSITYVPLPVPTTINQCFHGGWRNVVDTQGHPFKNQGLCVAFVVHQRRDT